MTNQSEAIQILPEQSLQILALFPKRAVTNVSVQLASFAKLYELLCCPICRQLLQSPAYLKCSHRFCKECIERYIRCSRKKSCPICRGILTTRRDLRPDHNIRQLISLAFGDTCVLKQKLNLIEASQVQRLTGNNSCQKIEGKSNKRRRTAFNQNQDVHCHGNKKIKTDKQQQVGLISREASPSITTICMAVQKQSQESSRNLQQSPNNKRQLTVHQSSKTPESNELLSSKFMKCANVSVTPLAQSKSLTTSTVPQHFESQKRQKVTNQHKNKSQNCSIKSAILQKKQQLPVANTPIVSPVQKAKTMLRQQFGQQYLYKLVQHSKTTIYVQFEIRRHPLNVFTPNLPFKTIQIPANYALYKVAYIISKQLNIHPDAVRFYAKNSKFQNLRQLSKRQILLQIAKAYWQIKNIFSLCHLSEMINKMSIQTKNIASIKDSNSNNVLYFCIDHRRLIPR